MPRRRGSFIWERPRLRSWARRKTKPAPATTGRPASPSSGRCRIEPDNPLVWIEYGRVELGAGDAAQADGMGRKALQLATGDPSAQAAAWHLIADSLRARGNNELAAEAEQHAASFSTR